MPKDGSVLLSEYPGEVVVLACQNCDRLGRYNRERLFQKYGDIRLVELRAKLTEGCPNLADQWHTCRAHFPELLARLRKEP